MKWHTIFLRINPASIGFFKFILEGYDGLAILSTNDQTCGIVTLHFPESAWPVLHNLIAAIQHKLTD